MAPAASTATRSTTSGAASATAPNAIAATARPVGGTRSAMPRTWVQSVPGAGGCHTAAAAVVTSNAPAHTTQHRTASGSSHVSSTARTAASPVTTCGATVATSAVSPATAATAAPTRIAAARRAPPTPTGNSARSARTPPDDSPPAPAPPRGSRPAPTSTAAAPVNSATASAIQASHCTSSAACTSASGGPSAVSVKVTRTVSGMRVARSGRSRSSASDTRSPASTTVSVTVPASASKAERWRSRTEPRTTAPKAALRTTPSAAPNTKGRTATRSGWAVITASVSRRATSALTASVCKACSVRAAKRSASNTSRVANAATTLTMSATAASTARAQETARRIRPRTLRLVRHGRHDPRSTTWGCRNRVALGASCSRHPGPARWRRPRRGDRPRRRRAEPRRCAVLAQTFALSSRFGLVPCDRAAGRWRGAAAKSRRARVARVTPSPDAEVAALAARQHGVVTLVQLRDAGLDKDAVRRRVLGGRLHRVHRGVYAVGHAGLSREGRWMAAVLGAGEDSALSHLSAASFWDVSRWRTSRISVTTTKRRQLESVEVHTVRQLDPRDVLVHNGIPVTNVARMCVDLTDELDAVPARVRHLPGRVLAHLQPQGHRGRDGARERAPQPARPRTRARAQCERLRRHAQRQGGRVPPPADRRAARERQGRRDRGRLPLARRQAHRRGRRGPSPPARHEARRTRAGTSDSLRAGGVSSAFRTTKTPAPTTRPPARTTRAAGGRASSSPRSGSRPAP